MDPRIDAIQAGITRAAENGLTRPYDVANAVLVSLSSAGLKIVRDPRAGR